MAAKSDQINLGQWFTRLLLGLITIIGFFIANTLTGMEKEREKAATDRKEIRKDISQLQQDAARTEERYINIQKSLEEIKTELRK